MKESLIGRKRIPGNVEMDMEHFEKGKFLSGYCVCGGTEIQRTPGYIVRLSQETPKQLQSAVPGNA